MEDNHPGLAFVSALYQCRELGAGLARFTTAASLLQVRHTPSGGSYIPTGEPVTSGAALVAKLVLKELDTPEHEFTCDVTRDGMDALQHLQRVVFGEGSMQHGFADCVYLATLAQAVQVLQLVTAALVDLVATDNCLSLLNLATSCGCVPLQAKARAHALHAFPAACQQDVQGLLAMEEGSLLSLLRSDALRVASEVEAFSALAAWTESRPEQRKAGFASRLAACVRLGCISMEELYCIDDHPLVAADRLANMLMAQVYLHFVMDVPLDAPLGLRTTPRRRICQRDSGSAATSCEAQETAAAADSEGTGAAAVPASPPAIINALTPTITARFGASAVAGVTASAEAQQMQPNVQHADVPMHTASRRTLFGAGASKGAPSAAQAPATDSAAAGFSGGASGSIGSTTSSMLGSVGLEMCMSPSRASIKALVQQAAAATAAAAAAPAVASWESRKRLRFE